MERDVFAESLNILDKIKIKRCVTLDEESQEILLIITKNTEHFQRANKK